VRKGGHILKTVSSIGREDQHPGSRPYVGVEGCAGRVLARLQGVRGESTTVGTEDATMCWWRTPMIEPTKVDRFPTMSPNEAAT